MSTATVSCTRVLLTECSFDDPSNTTYINTWHKINTTQDCQQKCINNGYPDCHFWIYHSSNQTCEMYERDRRTCHAVGGPASLSAYYCTGMKSNKAYDSLQPTSYKK